MFKTSQQPAYVSVISIVIIGAVATSIAISLLAGGTNATKNSLTNIRLMRARLLADTCVEEALQRIRDTAYTGTFNLSLSSGACSATVSSIAYPNYTISSTGSTTGAIKAIIATVNQINPKIKVSGWGEAGATSSVPVVNIITRVGSASAPADNGTQGGTLATIVPPAGLVAGDVVVIVASYRGTPTLSISNTGGQTWTSLTQVNGTTITGRIFYTVFNGTWSANPSVANSSGAVALTAVMHAFRNVDPSVIDVAQVGASFVAPVTPFDVNRAGITTITPGAMVLAAWVSNDDNTWALQSAGWANIGLPQYRNLSGSDTSVSTAYKLMSAVGPSGAAINRQLTLGGDDGVYFILALKPKP